MLNYRSLHPRRAPSETSIRPTFDTLSMSSVKNGTEQALGDESQVPQLIGAYVTCLIIAYTGVALRFLCRHMKQTRLGTDDWLILASLVSSDSHTEIYHALMANADFGKFFTTAFAGTNISLTRDGLGRHKEFITNAKFFALVRTPSPANTMRRLILEN